MELPAAGFAWEVFALVPNTRTSPRKFAAAVCASMLLQMQEASTSMQCLSNYAVLLRTGCFQSTTLNIHKGSPALPLIGMHSTRFAVILPASSSRLLEFLLSQYHSWNPNTIGLMPSSESS